MLPIWQPASGGWVAICNVLITVFLWLKVTTHIGAFFFLVIKICLFLLGYPCTKP